MKLAGLFLLWLFTSPLAATTLLRAQISAPVAEIYAEPSFRSAVIDRLKQGEVIDMAPDKIVGNGGLGVFYRIRTPLGKLGYVTDSDMVVTSAPRPVPKTTESKNESYRQPAMWGLSLAAVDYAEKFFGQKYHSVQPLYGLRRTGSANSPGELRSDFTLAFSPGAPKFLGETPAYGPDTGYLIIADALLMIPVVGNNRFMTSFEIGPSVVYSTYKIDYGNGPYSSSVVRVGLDADLGVAIQRRQWAIRADVKCYVERTVYPGAGITILLAL